MSLSPKNRLIRNREILPCITPLTIISSDLDVMNLTGEDREEVLACRIGKILASSQMDEIPDNLSLALEELRNIKD